MQKNLYGMRLKEARKRTSLSQTHLGILAGFDEFSASARMSQYETGKHLPDLGTAIRLAEVLDVPLAYFFCPDDGLADLIQLYHHLENDQQQAALNLFRSMTKKPST